MLYLKITENLFFIVVRLYEKQLLSFQVHSQDFSVALVYISNAFLMINNSITFRMTLKSL